VASDDPISAFQIIAIFALMLLVLAVILLNEWK
jgi:hypothetical protein